MTKDQKELHQAADNLDGIGTLTSQMLAGIFRVQADNLNKPWKRAHKNNLGPYSCTNIRHCVNCGVLGSSPEWQNACCAEN